MCPKRCGSRWEGRLALVSLIMLGSSLFVIGCGHASAPPPAAEKPKVESELARTTLSSAAYKSLGIAIQPVKNQLVQEQLPLTGWVMAKQGNEVTITAPVAGYIRAAATLPVAGLSVPQGQELFTLEPVLTPLEQIQLAALLRGVESELAKARASVTAA